MAQRDRIYPAAFRELLDQLGVDANKEAEAVAYGPHPSGSHHYCGWFFLAGELITAGEQLVAGESPYFAYHFTRAGPCPKEFQVVPHIGLEFDAHIPWILEESWDSDFIPKR